MFEKVTFDGWPSGDSKPVLELTFEPDEIEKKYGLAFLRDRDDLDWYRGAHFYDAELGVVVLTRHESSPSSGTGVYVDASIDTSFAIKKIKAIFDLDSKDILWVPACDSQKDSG